MTIAQIVALADVQWPAAGQQEEHVERGTARDLFMLAGMQ